MLSLECPRLYSAEGLTMTVCKAAASQGRLWELQPRSVCAAGRRSRTTWHRESARTLLVLVGDALSKVGAVVRGLGAGRAVATALILPQG